MRDQSAIQHVTKIQHRVVLFRIQNTYEPGMNRQEVYDCTRGVWHVAARRRKAGEYEYGLGVVSGIVKGVFTIDEWHPAGTTEYETRDMAGVNLENRWEFTENKPPAKDVEDMYLRKSVRPYLRGPNPVRFIPD